MGIGDILFILLVFLDWIDDLSSELFMLKLFKWLLIDDEWFYLSII